MENFSHHLSSNTTPKTNNIKAHYSFDYVTGPFSIWPTDIKTPGCDNQSSDISECMSNASSGEDSLSSSASDQMDQL